MNETKKNYIVKIMFIVIPIILVAGLGTIFVNIGMDWFDGLTKPTQWIPNFVIPIVWTIIYLAFSILLSRVIKTQIFSKKTTILLIINGALNIIWCLLFFTLQQTFIGLIAIILNLIFAFYLTINLFQYNKTYAYILSIYPIWISIATTLNLCLWILN